MRKLLPVLTIAPLALAACTPTALRPATSQIYPQMTLQGNTINVNLINAGPYDLLLENTCPRPFAVNFTEYPGKDKGGLEPRQLDTCYEQKLRPVTWKVGENLNLSIPVSYPAGTHTFKAFATVRARVLQPKGQVNNFASMNISLPEVKFTSK